MNRTRLEGDEGWELLQITNSEMRYILKTSGFTMTAFGIFLGRSHTFVGELGLYSGFIPSQYARALSQYVTPDAFALHLAQARQAEMEYNNRTRSGVSGGHRG